MPVSLFTGLPGAGKTASLVKAIVDLSAKEPGRPIFQIGINGLKEGLAIPLTEEQLHKWWELPPGSIICIDECQEDGSNPDQPISLMPKDRGMPAAWVQRITRVRHTGMDFLLTTQHPANMSAYVRRLVDRHVHSVMRAKGVRQTYEWQRCIDDPDNRREKKNAQMSFASVPKEVFDLYKSSALHTMKVRTPRKFYLIGALAVVALALCVLIPWRMHKTLHPDARVDAAPVALASASAAANEALRVSDYAKWSRPRVAGIPWTAPMFDGLKVTAQPRMFCIAVDDGRCSCLTEQGTKLVVAASVCRAVASAGVYDPFLVASDGGSGQSRGNAPERREAASPPAALAHPVPLPGVSAGAVVDSSDSRRATAAPYVPPEYMPPNT
jgi:zona occludens toxin